MRKALPFMQTVASSKTSKQTNNNNNKKRGVYVHLCMSMSDYACTQFACVCALGPACKRRCDHVCVRACVCIHRLFVDPIAPEIESGLDDPSTSSTPVSHTHSGV